MQLKWIAVGIILFGSGATVMADSIILRNGNAFEGTVVKADDVNVVFRLRPDDDGEVIEMTFERETVREIRYSSATLLEDAFRAASSAEPENGTTAPPSSAAPKADTPVREDKTPVAPVTPLPEAPKTETGAGTAPGKGEEPTPPSSETTTDKPIIDPAIRQQIESFMGALQSVDQKDRDAATARLKAMGEMAVPLLAETLSTSKSMTQARSINRLLGEMGDKRVVRLLIDQLQGGRDDQSRMEWAWISLRKLTGQEIHFSSDANQMRRNSQRQEWLDWFETVKKNYPEQLAVEAEQEAALQSGIAE